MFVFLLSLFVCLFLYAERSIAPRGGRSRFGCQERARKKKRKYGKNKRNENDFASINEWLMFSKFYLSK
jgi:hypothetical protein